MILIVPYDALPGIAFWQYTMIALLFCYACCIPFFRSDKHSSAFLGAIAVFGVILFLPCYYYDRAVREQARLEALSPPTTSKEKP